MFRVIFSISLLAGLLFAQASNKSDYIITEKQKQGEVINIELNSYKILQFSKRITDITLNSSENVSVNYLTKNTKIPFSKIKVFAKKMGKAYALVTFMDKSVTQINFNVVSDIKDLEAVVRSIGENVYLTKINDNIVLKGMVKNNKDKAKIIDIVKNYQKDIKIVDLIKTIEPNLMVKMKLFIAEIQNGHTKELSSQWALSFTDGTTTAATADIVTSAFADAVTTTGGISAVASVLGSKFNAAWALNFLSTKNIARVLDESELLTQEGKQSVFHAGGTFFVRLDSANSTGSSTTTELREIDYGLMLDMKVNEVINNEYIDLTITTNQDKIDSDPEHRVDAIPGLLKQSIETHVIVKDKNTIVLGGLVNKSDAKRFEKVPFLGDIPILGELFKSKNFINGKSELVFFIVPEIVDPQVNSNEQKAQNVTEYYETNEFKDKLPTDENLMK